MPALTVGSVLGLPQIPRPSPGRLRRLLNVVSEALANAAKHARASACHVDAGVAGDVLRLAVRDDGVGGADPARGSSLAGLTDRVAALGGILSVRSRPGQGTTLLAELPSSSKG